MIFEPTISLGALISGVLTALSVILSVALMYTRLVARYARLETKVNLLWSVLRRRLGADVRREDDEEFFR